MVALQVLKVPAVLSGRLVGQCCAMLLMVELAVSLRQGCRVALLAISVGLLGVWFTVRCSTCALAPTINSMESPAASNSLPLCSKKVSAYSRNSALTGPQPGYVAGAEQNPQFVNLTRLAVLNVAMYYENVLGIPLQSQEVASPE